MPVVSLDSLKLPPPDVIKMDIEGGESDALKGARTLLVEHKPIIVLALHGPEHADFCPEFLRSCGYRVLSLKGNPINAATLLQMSIYAVPL